MTALPRRNSLFVFPRRNRSGIPLKLIRICPNERVTHRAPTRNATTFSHGSEGSVLTPGSTPEQLPGPDRATVAVCSASTRNRLSSVNCSRLCVLRKAGTVDGRRRRRMYCGLNLRPTACSGFNGEPAIHPPVSARPSIRRRSAVRSNL